MTAGSQPKFIRSLGEWTLRNRWPIIIVNLALLGLVMAFMARRGQEFGDHVAYMKSIRQNPERIRPDHKAPPPIFDADYHVWFAKDNPDLVAFDAFQRTFAKEELGMVAVKARNGDIFTNENLATHRTLTDRLWTVPYVTRVDCLVNFNHTSARGDELLVEDFIPSLPLSDRALLAKKRSALTDPIISKFLVSPDAGMTQVSLRVIAPKDYPEAHLEAKHAMDSLVDLARAENPGLEFKMGGTVVMTSAFNEYATDDFKTLVPLMYVIIIVILSALLRSFWGTVMPMGLLLTSISSPSSSKACGWGCPSGTPCSTPSRPISCPASWGPRAWS